MPGLQTSSDGMRSNKAYELRYLQLFIDTTLGLTKKHLFVYLFEMLFPIWFIFVFSVLIGPVARTSDTTMMCGWNSIALLDRYDDTISKHRKPK